MIFIFYNYLNIFPVFLCLVFHHYTQPCPLQTLAPRTTPRRGRPRRRQPVRERPRTSRLSWPQLGGSSLVPSAAHVSTLCVQPRSTLTLGLSAWTAPNRSSTRSSHPLTVTTYWCRGCGVFTGSRCFGRPCPTTGPVMVPGVSIALPGSSVPISVPRFRSTEVSLPAPMELTLVVRVSVIGGVVIR